jgi:hypothetical protein
MGRQSSITSSRHCRSSSPELERSSNSSSRRRRSSSSSHRSSRRSSSPELLSRIADLEARCERLRRERDEAETESSLRGDALLALKAEESSRRAASAHPIVPSAYLQQLVLETANQLRPQWEVLSGLSVLVCPADVSEQLEAACAVESPVRIVWRDPDDAAVQAAPYVFEVDMSKADSKLLQLWPMQQVCPYVDPMADSSSRRSVRRALVSLEQTAADAQEQQPPPVYLDGYPSCWLGRTEIDRVELLPDSALGCRLMQFMLSSLVEPSAATMEGLEIKRIERVENHLLWENYQRYRHSVEKRMNSLGSRRPAPLSQRPSVAQILDAGVATGAGAVPSFFTFTDTDGDHIRIDRNLETGKLTNTVNDGVARYTWQSFDCATCRYRDCSGRGTVPEESKSALVAWLASGTNAPKGGDALLPDELRSRILCDETSEMWLFHGTKPSLVDVITTHGVDPRRSNMHGLYGAGSYFADSAGKSHQYSKHIDQDGCRRMLLCRVTMGDTFMTDRSHQNERLPPENPDMPGRSHDSIFAETGVAPGMKPTRGARGGQMHNEYVVFHPDAVYVEYIIHYTVSASGSLEPQPVPASCPLKDHMKRCGLEAWHGHLSMHLGIKSVASLRAMTAIDLRRMATRAHMRLDQKTIDQVLEAVKRV